jgi:hypothetical protein
VDPQRFDTLIKTRSRTGTRRRLLSLAAALPLAGVLITRRGPGATAGRQDGDGKPNNNGNGNGNGNGRGDRDDNDRDDNDRNDQDDGLGDPEIFQKGISTLLNNHLEQMTHAELGILIHGSSGGCRSPAPFDMPPLTGIALYDTQHPESYSWVEDRYFFGFFNPDIGLPGVWVAEGGSSKGLCHSGGTRLLNDYELKVGQAATVSVANRRFIITRQKDTEFKVFVVDIFAA